MNLLPVFIALSLWAFLPSVHPQNSTRINDNSDWWSSNRTDEADDVEIQKGELAGSTFQILGVELGDSTLERATSKLGSAVLVQRGDASTGRMQACYVSQGSHQKVYLIFEQGEVGYSFYLFTGGADWSGSENCVASPRISFSTATRSGLHLGQTPAEVISILGRPTKRSPGEFIYSFSTQKRTSPEDLAEDRKRNPNMSDKDFHENFGHYTRGEDVRAKFTHSRLTFLSVSKAEFD